MVSLRVTGCRLVGDALLLLDPSLLRGVGAEDGIAGTGNWLEAMLARRSERLSLVGVDVVVAVAVGSPVTLPLFAMPVVVSSDPTLWLPW